MEALAMAMGCGDGHGPRRWPWASDGVARRRAVAIEDGALL